MEIFNIFIRNYGALSVENSLLKIANDAKIEGVHLVVKNWTTLSLRKEGNGIILYCVLLITNLWPLLMTRINTSLGCVM